MTEEQYIHIPKSWLIRLKELADSQKHYDLTKLNLLEGYISSVDTLLKYNRIDHE